MKRSPFSVPSAPQGRPRETELTPDQAKEFQQKVLLGNKDGKSGSASMAFRVLCREHPEIGWDPHARASKHQIPAVAKELARKAQGLTGFHRQGERGLRSTGAYTPGMLRRTADGMARLLSGDHVSYDDGTINIPVVIPWPYGGCELSEKHKVKLGRFQLLCPHDEGSSYVPSFEFVIRESQGYRGPDAGGAVLRFARDICRPGFFVFEGGVWQGRRMKRIMEGAGVGLIDVKGRPWQKMIENFFNRLWTRLGMCKGLASVGRFRGEEKEISEFYVKCRAGKADPRGKFPWLNDVLEGLETSIRFLNSDRIESAVYGKWVPEERWSMDMEEHPRPVMSGENLWLAAPVMEKRKVTRNGVVVAATGPLGLKMRYQFTGPCLWEWEGKDVEIYFDPLGEWPIHGIVALPGKSQALGRVECCNPYYEGGSGAEVAKSLREVMRREYRLLWSGGKHFDKSARETEIRGTEGVIEVQTNFSRSGTDQPAEREKNQRFETPEVLDPPHPRVAAESPFDTAAAREGSVLMSRTTRGGVDSTSAAGRLAAPTHVSDSGGDRGVMPAPAADPLRSLSRRAAAARERVPNW